MILQRNRVSGLELDLTYSLRILLFSGAADCVVTSRQYPAAGADP